MPTTRVEGRLRPVPVTLSRDAVRPRTLRAEGCIRTRPKHTACFAHRKLTLPAGVRLSGAPDILQGKRISAAAYSSSRAHTVLVSSGECVENFLYVVVLFEFVDDFEYFRCLRLRQLRRHRADVFVLG